MIDIIANPEAIRNLKDDDVVIVEGKRLTAAWMNLGEEQVPNIGFTLEGSRVDEYNRLIYEYEDGLEPHYPSYTRFIKHLRFAVDGRLGDALATPDEWVERIKAGTYYIG